MMDSEPRTINFMYGGVCMPTQIVGGDFYRFYQVDTHRTGIILSDITGKGIKSALIFDKIATITTQIIQLSLPPNESLSQLNKAVVRDPTHLKLLPSFWAILDPNKGALTYSSGGNIDIFLYEENQPLSTLEKTGPICGLDENEIYTNKTIPMKEGSIALICTDGVTESKNNNNIYFNAQNIQAFLDKYRYLEPTFIAEYLFKEVKAYTQLPLLKDDFTVIIIKAVKQDTTTNNSIISNKKEKGYSLLLNTYSIAKNLAYLTTLFQKFKLHDCDIFELKLVFIELCLLNLNKEVTLFFERHKIRILFSECPDRSLIAHLPGPSLFLLKKYTHQMGTSFRKNKEAMFSIERYIQGQ